MEDLKLGEKKKPSLEKILQGQGKEPEDPPVRRGGYKGGDSVLWAKNMETD